MRTLVVYWSRTGRTRQVAEDLAWRLGANLEALEERQPHAGSLGGVLTLLRVTFGAEPVLQPTRHDPARYDRVIVGTPVVAGDAAPAVCSYLSRHAGMLPQVAFFATRARPGHHRAFASMQRLCRRAPAATLAVVHGTAPGFGYAEPVRWFADRLAAA